MRQELLLTAVDQKWGSGKASENRQYDIDGGVSELNLPTIFSNFQLSSIHKISDNTPESQRQPISSPSRVSHKASPAVYTALRSEDYLISRKVWPGPDRGACCRPNYLSHERRDVADWATFSDCIFPKFFLAYHSSQKTCTAVSPERTLGPFLRSQKPAAW